MDWIFLIIASSGEIFGVMGINRVNHERSIASFALLIGGFSLSFFFLALAMQTIPMGTAYAVWTGIGTAGSAIIGMLLFNESRDWRRMLFIAMILTAAVGLKLIS
ncbi:QacE family quaternary ammonium compound efflux SMR transporter [Oceanobacillus arenosus]|uniref:QacE family quaternary ammonium compound efflux SMR transporter n=1 Tax=Oceanobacillus arenosus TaxID=1229153 RepID=A0A3D8PSW8_9BACI|nr:multidrug efflux SMR transporter [Oceanobacillus arenosus]RDW18667.1 QacE family quaternary ammonium compound efflux SMR transporter [Oceanobacillus arenosus]